MDSSVVNANAVQFFLNAVAAIQASRTSNHQAKLIRRFRTLKKRRLRTMIALLAYIEQETRKAKIPPVPEGPPKRIWVLHRDQYMFEELLAGNLPEETWHQNFHVSRKTFLRFATSFAPNSLGRTLTCGHLFRSRSELLLL